MRAKLENMQSLTGSLRGLVVSDRRSAGSIATECRAIRVSVPEPRLEFLIPEKSNNMHNCGSLPKRRLISNRTGLLRRPQESSRKLP